MVFLGTGGSGGPPGRAHNCVLVESSKARLVLDFGEGCSWRLYELGLTLCDIDAVYVSHLHVDHYVGLFDAAVHSVARGCRRVDVAASEKIAEQVYSVLANALPRSVVDGLKVTGIDRGGLRIGDLMVTPVPSCHAVPCYGVVVSEAGGTSILYTGDTRPCSNLYDEAGRVVEPDMVVHEAALPDHLARVAEEHGHSTPSAAVEAVHSRWPDALVALVHLSADSLRQLLAASRLPRGVLVPSDMTVVSL